MQKLNIYTIIFIMLFVFSINAVSALTFEQNSKIDLTYPCTYNGTICAPTTTCNVSVIYPNGSLMIENKQSTYTGTGIANHTITDSSINGVYKVPITCNFANGDADSGSADFEITPNGETLNLSKTIIYLGLIFILIIILTILLYSMIAVDNFGWRIGLIGLSYVVSNIFFLSCWKTSEAFLTAVPFLGTLFHVLFITSTAGYFPFFLGLIIYFLLDMFNEKSINTLIGRGYSEEEARTRVGRQ